MSSVLLNLPEWNSLTLQSLSAALQRKESILDGEIIMLTVIVNDVDNCSVSDMFSYSFQTSNEIGKCGIEIQLNSVIILQCDFIIGSEQTDLSTWQSACD